MSGKQLTRSELLTLARIAAGGGHVPVGSLPWSGITDALHMRELVVDLSHVHSSHYDWRLTPKGWKLLKEYQDEQEDKVRLP